MSDHASTVPDAPVPGAGPDEGPSCGVMRDSGPAIGDTDPTSVLSNRLEDHTTFHLGGPAKRLVVVTTQQELCETVRAVDASGEPLLVLSGGSNLVVADEGFEGTVVKVATRGWNAEVSSCGGAFVTVQAGECWDDFVALAVGRSWVGVEALSGIPGLVGATPVQNVGAYGADVSQTIARVRTLDRVTGEYRTFIADECGFGYRDSIFKRTRMSGGGPTGRYVVLDVSFHFELGDRSAPIRYPELARTLGVGVGDRVPTREVRDAVLRVRRSKGMVHDPADHDSWSAGSFFTNPILSSAEAASLPEEAPRFPVDGGGTKTSAAWLIDHAGFHKGFGEPPATLSTRHTLALTNRGGARTSDVLDLARTIRGGVEHHFGVRLEPEPVLVGCALD